jgi:RNA polymerase sigma-70 factor (ECF subfamily)
MAGKQMQELLAQMIATLPDDLRHPLELSTVQELSSAEIAQILSIPEGSVRTRLMRARQLLKQKLSAVLEAKHG